MVHAQSCLNCLKLKSSLEEEVVARGEDVWFSKDQHFIRDPQASLCSRMGELWLLCIYLIPLQVFLMKQSGENKTQTRGNKGSDGNASHWSRMEKRPRMSSG